jgi:hypothetical protein
VTGVAYGLGIDLFFHPFKSFPFASRLDLGDDDPSRPGGGASPYSMYASLFSPFSFGLPVLDPQSIFQVAPFLLIMIIIMII